MGSPLLPIGARFAECYTLFNFHVNTQLLARPDVQRSHAIDGKTFPLLDCRYIPGNGQQVAGGLTVWTSCKTYMWMSAMVLGLCELLQKMVQARFSLPWNVLNFSRSHHSFRRWVHQS